MTVAELRTILASLPDDMPVTWEPPDPENPLLLADVTVVRAIQDSLVDFFETPDGEVRFLKIIPKGP